MALKNTHGNLKLTSLDVQKYITNALANKSCEAIINDLGDGLFVIIEDESCDV